MVKQNSYFQTMLDYLRKNEYKKVIETYKEIPDDIIDEPTRVKLPLVSPKEGK